MITITVIGGKLPQVILDDIILQNGKYIEGGIWKYSSLEASRTDLRQLFLTIAGYLDDEHTLSYKKDEIKWNHLAIYIEF